MVAIRQDQRNGVSAPTFLKILGIGIAPFGWISWLSLAYRSEHYPLGAVSFNTSKYGRRVAADLQREQYDAAGLPLFPKKVNPCRHGSEAAGNKPAGTFVIHPWDALGLVALSLQRLPVPSGTFP